MVRQRVSEAHAGEELFEPIRDARWRSYDALAQECAGVTALLVALHAKLGPRALGDALNHLDAEDERRRVNGVRYTTFRELQEGLLATLEEKARRKRVEELFR